MLQRYWQGVRDFWPYYVTQHSRPLTRWLHFVGNTNLFIWLFVAMWRRSLSLLPFAVLSSYAFAWIGHFFVERNRPATFKYPLKAAICDMIMYGKMWRGAMDDEVSRYVR
jgi:hypothetical protein